MVDNGKELPSVLQKEFAKITVQNKTLSIASIVGLAHIIAGYSIFMNPKGLFVTPLYLFHTIIDYFGFNYKVSALTLIWAGAMAILGSAYGLFLQKKVYIFCFIPQQLLLTLQIFSIALAISAGHYPDGYVPEGGSWFILTDQIWAWMLPMAHTLWLWVVLGHTRDGE